MISVILSVLAKPKKLLNTFILTGFKSVETGNRLLTYLLNYEASQHKRRINRSLLLIIKPSVYCCTKFQQN